MEDAYAIARVNLIELYNKYKEALAEVSDNYTESVSFNYTSCVETLKLIESTLKNTFGYDPEFPNHKHVSPLEKGIQILSDIQSGFDSGHESKTESNQCP